LGSSVKIMPDAVESVQEIDRYASAGGLETSRSERRFELVFGGGSGSLDHTRNAAEASSAVGNTSTTNPAAARPRLRSTAKLVVLDDQ
jgi:hypothetical protein